MSKLTVANIKNSSIPRTLSVCPDDPRLLQWANEAESRMLAQGRWWGSIRLMNLCVTNGCLTQPREVENVEQMAVNGQPIPIYTTFYGFTQNLAVVNPCKGCASPNSSNICNTALFGACGHIQSRDQGEAVSHNVTRGRNKKIRFYPSNIGDVGKTIIVQGYDLNGIWVRSIIDGVMQDGEEVTLASPYVDTTTVWSAGAPTGIIKEATLDVVRMYSFNTDTSTEKLLSAYQASETKPSYRRFVIPQFRAIPKNQCCTNEDGDVLTTIQTIAKLRHIELVSDNDWLLFEILEAYKSAMIAVKAWEENDDAKGNYHFYGIQASPSAARNTRRVVNRGGAIPLLNAELQSKTGLRTDAFWHAEYTNSLPNRLIGFW